jgi:hypothetical protein
LAVNQFVAGSSPASPENFKRLIMHLKVDDVIVIHWVDQNSYTSPHPAKGALRECDGHTLGFFLEENADWICVATEKMQIQGTDDEPNYRHVISIPKGAIKSITKLQILEVGRPYGTAEDTFRVRVETCR